jgi:DNA-binding IclR family transcriptional regulator
VTATTTHQSLKRGLRIIETVAQMVDPPTLSAIARKTSLNRSTTHHILKALVEFGYLVQSPDTCTYSLSSRLFRITRQTWTTEQLADIAGPYLEDLSRRTGEGTSLAVLSEGEVIIAAKCEPEGPLRVVQEIGSTRPIHCTAVGKILAAWLEKEELEEIIQRTEFEKKTPKTILTPAAFRRELAMVRESGVAVDNEEHIKGIRCMAGPVRDHNSGVRAALCVVGPRDHLPPRRMKKIRLELLTVAADLSSRLGYRPARDEAEGA